MLHVFEAQAYRQAKHMTEEWHKPKNQTPKLPTTRLFQLVNEIEYDLFKEAVAAAEAKANG
jgi:hypothetical protein